MAVQNVKVFFETLSVQVIQQKPTLTIASLLGGSAGMLGVLLGLNAINLIFGIEGLLMRAFFNRGNIGG